MTRRVSTAFLALSVVQAGHSIEEYSTRLYDVLAPARYVSGLISADRRVGFLIFNVSLVAFGLWCYFGPVRQGTPSAVGLAWFWVVLEALNSLAHAIWAVWAGGYRPGLVTAPLLLIVALVLAWQLARAASTTRAAV
jgi:hypothetical protein